MKAFIDATRAGYEDCIKDPDAAAEILLKAAPELEPELVHLIESDPETVKAFIDATRAGYEDCIKDPDAAAEILLKAAPELEPELVHASQTYLAEQYQADASMWGQLDQQRWDDFQLDQQRWDDFFGWVTEQGFAAPIEPGAGMTTEFIGA